MTAASRRFSAGWPRSLRELDAALLSSLEQCCIVSGALCEEVILAVWIDHPELFGGEAIALLERILPPQLRTLLRSRIDQALRAVRSSVMPEDLSSVELSPALRELIRDERFHPSEPGSFLTLLGQRRSSLLRRILPRAAVEAAWPAGEEEPQAQATVRVASGALAGLSAPLTAGCPFGIGRNIERLGVVAEGGLGVSDRTISRWENPETAPLSLSIADGNLRVRLLRGVLGWEQDLWDQEAAPAPSRLGWDWASPASLSAPCDVSGRLPVGEFIFRYGQTTFILSNPAPSGKATSPVTVAAPARSQAAAHQAASGPEPLFSWIHLSDLHFGHGGVVGRWDQRVIQTMILRDLESLLSRTVSRLDAVLVTGDVASSGDAGAGIADERGGEYEEAARFLNSLGQLLQLEPSRIFTVPGNHDVSRSVDQNRQIKRLLEALRKATSTLDEALGDSSDRDMLRQRLARYLSFSAQFAPACLLPENPPPLWWSHRLQPRGEGGLPVRLIGLNSALLSANEHDLGHLCIGAAALTELSTPPPEPSEFLLVMSHHPFRGGWLADEKNCDAWVRSLAHVHLFGHVHEADFEEVHTGGGGHVVRINAGASYDGQTEASAPSSHSYNIAAVYAQPSGQLMMRIWPRRWSDKNKAFRADIDNLSDGQNFVEHMLRR